MWDEGKIYMQRAVSQGERRGRCNNLMTSVPEPLLCPSQTEWESDERAMDSGYCRSKSIFTLATSRNPLSWRMRVGWRILRRALASIWRMRSRVTRN